MSHRLRALLYALGVILVLTLIIITWRASVTVAQEGEPASLSGLTVGPARIEPAELVPGGPGFYAQNALAFRAYPNQAVPFSYAGAKLVNPDTVSHYYMAPVALPHGALITKFVVWYYDNDTGKELSVDLYRLPLESEYGTSIASVSSAGASASNRYAQDTSISTPVVDLQSYSYAIQASLPASPSVGLVAFRIDYQYTNSLPLIMKK
jgi:hypothetical protein